MFNFSESQSAFQIYSAEKLIAFRIQRLSFFDFIVKI